MQLVLDFLVNQQLFLALAQEDARPLAQALATRAPLRHTAQWAEFLRNHDELDLGRLSASQRDTAFQRLGAAPEMQLYGRGLRRRLASMLEGDRRRIQLAHSLLLTLPGTPVLWYGDEIGMGEHLGLDARAAVRTPMQWSSEPNAGFSRAPQVARAVVDSGPFSYEAVNVADQRRDPESLLNWMERMIRIRKETPEIGWGRWEVLRTNDEAVLGIAYTWKGSAVIAVHNLAGSARRAELELDAFAPGAFVDMLSGEALEAPPAVPCHLVLEPYGFRWLRAGGEDGALSRRDG
jgi:maltose alpha-D-glucosyltransferase/alpha-amylase